MIDLIIVPNFAVENCREARKSVKMARKKVETNISYDEARQCYYVCMDYGPDENGRRIKKYKTFSNLPLARKALKEFHTERESQRSVTPAP